MHITTDSLSSENADISLIQGCSVAIIGYGNQGRAQALNLRDSGVQVHVGARRNGAGWAEAINDGLMVFDIPEATRRSDCIMLLLPDEITAEVYSDLIAPHLLPTSYLGMAHGFSLHFGHIKLPPGVTPFLVAPKGPGKALRQLFLNGHGLPALVATNLKETPPDNSPALAMALSYAKAIGCTRAGVFLSSFREETETDLFGEQAVLCGGMIGIIKCGFETLLEAGYSPTAAYFECVHEVKLIADLIEAKGLTGMRQSISNTAEYGGYLAEKTLVNDDMKQKMNEILQRIQSGAFAQKLLDETTSGKDTITELRTNESQLPIEKVGLSVRQTIKRSLPSASAKSQALAGDCPSGSKNE